MALRTPHINVDIQSTVKEMIYEATFWAMLPCDCCLDTFPLTMGNKFLSG